MVRKSMTFSKAPGVARIRLAFVPLNIIVDITFMVAQENVSALSSMKDMLENCLNISSLSQAYKIEV